MNRTSILRLIASNALVLPVVAAVRPVAAAAAAGDVSEADRTFVAHVSQGGMYEVEASKLARHRARAQNVVDQSITEVHDHALVGDKLKTIALSIGLPFPARLDASFAARLAKLEALTGNAFDEGYLREMDAIHAVDVRAFANEAIDGSNPALKAFAAETVLIVRRHIGALHAVPLTA